jgi:hypothetical protein
MPVMKIMRYRRPSPNQLLGITTAKRRVRRSLGISQVEAWTKPSRVKQRAKSQLGLYSPAMRVLQQTFKGKIPTPFGVGSRTSK